MIIYVRKFRKEWFHELFIDVLSANNICTDSTCCSLATTEIACNEKINHNYYNITVHDKRHPMSSITIVSNLWLLRSIKRDL